MNMDNDLAVILAAVAFGGLDEHELPVVIALAAEAEERRRRPRICRRGRLDVYQLSKKRFRKLFRCRRRHLPRLRHALRIPNRVVIYNKSSFPGDLALLVLLRRLAYPGRLVDLSELFQMSVPELYMLFNRTIDIVHSNWSHLLDRLDRLDTPWLTPARLDEFCQSVRNAGAPYNNVWEFLDGTVNRICQPGQNQRIVYSSHKRTHCLKYQGLMSSCGLFANLFGPMEGQRHDMAMLEASGLRNQMAHHMAGPSNGPRPMDYVPYADQGYALEQFIQTPFRGVNVTPHEGQFNKTMSGMRVAVEWGFGRVGSLFAFCGYTKGLKVLLPPVAKYYRAAVLLMNCHSCLRPNQTSRKFGVRPPHLEEYLQ